MKMHDLLKHGTVFVPLSTIFSKSEGRIDELDPAARIRAHITGLFGNMNAAAAIGAAFLSVNRAEANADQLVAGIIGTGAPPPSAGLDAWIGARIAADFDAGDVTLVDGWLFARCEVRLCALASLMR